MFVLSPQLHLELFKEGDLMENISTLTCLGGHWVGHSGSPGNPYNGAPGGHPLPSLERPVSIPSPNHPQRFCFLECRSTRVRIPAAGPHPLHPKGWTVDSGTWGGGPRGGRQGGADREWAKLNLRQNHSPAGGSLG